MRRRRRRFRRFEAMLALDTRIISRPDSSPPFIFFSCVCVCVCKETKVYRLIANGNSKNRIYIYIYLRKNFSKRRKKRTKGALTTGGRLLCSRLLSCKQIELRGASTRGCYRGIISFIRRLDLRILRIKYARPVPSQTRPALR